jgi:hypothetical protein
MPSSFGVDGSSSQQSCEELPMQGIVFYYGSLANPAQAGNALAAHFQ